ncbi:hypothetical protein J6590_001729 [Homalodisca vitripennis]|nr:hypothetical protein J6590_001729 [Homalodisca vitripennis]
MNQFFTETGCTGSGRFGLSYTTREKLRCTLTFISRNRAYRSANRQPTAARLWVKDSPAASWNPDILRGQLIRVNTTMLLGLEIPEHASYLSREYAKYVAFTQLQKTAIEEALKEKSPRMLRQG